MILVLDRFKTTFVYIADQSFWPRGKRGMS